MKSIVLKEQNTVSIICNKMGLVGTNETDNNNTYTYSTKKGEMKQSGGY